MATQVILLDPNGGGAFYQNEYTYRFGSYTTKLHKAYSTIERYRIKTAPETIVTRMLDGMQVKNSLAIQLGKKHVKNNLLGDWLGAVAHMSVKVLEEISPRSGGGK